MNGLINGLVCGSNPEERHSTKRQRAETIAKAAGLVGDLSQLQRTGPLAAPLTVDPHTAQEALSSGLDLPSAAARRAGPLTNLVRHNT